MSSSTIQDFAAITSQVIGDLDTIASDAEPNPWFSKNIYRKRDLQWAGYLGPIGSVEKALAFGINLEFTPAWRRVYPKIKDNLQYFSQLLSRYPNYEWHWWGRPGTIAKNPKVKWLTAAMLTNQVDLTTWVSELEDILERRKMWSSNAPMRPQIQVMRQVGLPSQLVESAYIRQNIHQVVHDLEPLVEFLGK